MSWPFLRTLIDREAVASTSDLARDLVAEGGLATPFAVRARRQTKGRGRGTNSWWSDSGSLTFTLVIDPMAHGIGLEQEPKLALVSAVAIIDALRPLIPAHRAGIRWPNDVEVAGRKLGGILPEKAEGPEGPRILVGIGLNVLTRLDDAPDDVARMAVSLADLREGSLNRGDLDALFGAILTRFEGVLPNLAADDPTLAACWDALDTLRGREVRIDLGPRIVAGEGRGIDAGGALRLDVGGETRRIVGGRVLRDV